MDMCTQEATRLLICLNAFISWCCSHLLTLRPNILISTMSSLEDRSGSKERKKPVVHLVWQIAALEKKELSSFQKPTLPCSFTLGLLARSCYVFRCKFILIAWCICMVIYRTLSKLSPKYIQRTRTVSEECSRNERAKFPWNLSSWPQNMIGLSVCLIWSSRIYSFHRAYI